MPSCRGARSPLQQAAILLLAAIGLLLGGNLPTDAHAATGYGELTRFGGPGSGKAKEQFREESTHAIGVDPTDNSVYVLEDEKEPVENEKKHTLEHHYRLLKFKESGGTYKFVAEATFTETGPTPGIYEYENSIEGLAIDPGLKRVYALAVDTRAGGDEETGNGRLAKDEEARVASTLYAFSTVEAAEKLPPCNECKGEGMLTESAALEGQSEVTGRALLGPAGITVNPTTHEVLILAHVDEKGEPDAEDNPESETDHYVLQPINSNGKLGTRYLDTGNFLKHGRGFLAPDSPLAVGESVYVNYEGLVELPYKTAGAPRTVFKEPEERENATEVENAAGNVETGGGLSLSPEGTIFQLAEVNNALVPGGETKFGVALHRASGGAEIGWTGGQSPAVPGVKEDKCVLQPEFFEEPKPVLAAGKEGKVFVLAGEFLHFGSEASTKKAVIELGPGGSGCPEASAAKPQAEANGKVLKEGESIPQGTSVTLSSVMTQADALKSVWTFENPATKETEPPETGEADQFQRPTTTHKFQREGEWTVTETITSDDLAAPKSTVFEAGAFTSPLIPEGEKEKLTFMLNVQSTPPRVVLRGSTLVTLGEAAFFDGSGSKGPGGSKVEKYKWSFGDGSEQTTSPRQVGVEHAYAAVGTYEVELTVSYEGGKTAQSAPLIVTVSVPSGGPPPSETPAGSGGGESTNGGGGGGTGKPPGSGVLSYQASLASTSLAVKPTGALVVTVKCLGQSSCSGTVMLKTLNAVAAAKGKHKAILTLARSSFSVAGGHVKAVTLHLSSVAKRLLAKAHVLRVRATITAHDASGALHMTRAMVTLRPAKAKSHH